MDDTDEVLDHVRPVTHHRVPMERLRLLGLDHLDPNEAARVLKQQDDIRAAQRAAEGDRKARHAEAQHAEAMRRGEEYRQAGEERTRFEQQPFAWSYAGKPGDARPTFTLSGWGDGLAGAIRERLKREKAEDRAAADDAERRAHDGEPRRLEARLQALQADTVRQIDQARAEQQRARDAVTASLSEGKDPSEHEQAARLALELVATLEARLPLLASRLEEAGRAAERLESGARSRELAARRAAREEEQLRRESLVGPRLRELLRELYGLGEG